MRRSLPNHFVTRAAVALLAMMMSATFAVAMSASPAHAKYGAMIHPATGKVIKKIYRNCDGTRNTHGAIDVAGAFNSTIYAAYRGVVTDVWHNEQGGLNARVKHPSGYRTVYARMNADHRKVYEGRELSKGSVVGFMGNRGHNDGKTFLHFQVTRYGEVFTDLNKGFKCGNTYRAKDPIQVDFPGL